jgi:hypothetical protein
MTTTTDTAVKLTPMESDIVKRLAKAKAPMSKADLMKGITENEKSLKVLLVKLRKKGFDITSPTGKGVQAAYTMGDAGKALAKAAA